MHGLSRYRIMATLLFGLLLGLTTQTLASTERAPATADHTKFEALKGPFNSAPEVTALAGFPTDIPREWPKGSGTLVLPPDLAKVARNVGASDRENCGSCHFYGGGADGVKHGDLDSSLVNPSHELDVHMASDGLNFSCSDCHTSWGHNVAGSRYQVNAKDTLGIDVPGTLILVVPAVNPATAASHTRKPS